MTAPDKTAPDKTGRDRTRRDETRQDKIFYRLLMNTYKQDGSRTIAETSPEALLLYERLKQAQPGDEITYFELSKIIDRNVQTIANKGLYTARKRCENIDHIVFSVIRGVGLRRMFNDEIPRSTQCNIDHIRRTARRAAKRLACVSYEELSRTAQLTHNTNMSLLGVLSEVSKPGGGKLLEQQITISNKVLPIGRTMELFKG